MEQDQVLGEMSQLVGMYAWPSQAYWRFFEMIALRNLEYERPILEIGCGDGRFSSLVFDEIEDAIDLNARAVERSRTTGLYGRVRCMDARQLDAEPAAYGTIYANCVLEHIPDVSTVLASAREAIRPGGKLVITVPIREMNNHLLMRARWYAEFRQRQLVHINLFTADDWDQLLREHGFPRIEIRPYLYASQCRFWDAVDSLTSLGRGRYRISTALRLAGQHVLPSSLRRSMHRRVAHWLIQRARAPAQGPACAVLIVAS